MSFIASGGSEKKKKKKNIPADLLKLGHLHLKKFII